MCLSSKIEETARLVAPYNGSGYGLHLPVLVDDEVLVLAPMGEPDYGLIALPTSWDEADPPPQDVVDNPTDVVLVVKKDTSIRIVLEGSGNAVIEPRGSGIVKLGGESGLESAALAESLETRIALLETSFIAHVHTGVLVGAALSGVATPPPVLGTPTFQASKVKVK